MATGTLYNKVWEANTVARLPTGQTQLFVGLHMIHEVTSPQAFGMLHERGLKVAFPSRTFATVDHIVPTEDLFRPFADSQAEAMISALERNTAEHAIPFFGFGSGRQGIVHVVAPELGLVRPGMTVVCGDSHTSTMGAFGALAFGIGTSQVRDVLATQSIAMSPMKVRKIEVNGTLKAGISPKDVALFLIRQLGAAGGIGYVYEFCGKVFERMDMEGRMTVCNMAIEGGARAGYVNPDEITFRYLLGREYAPPQDSWDEAVAAWKNYASDESSVYDDVVVFDGGEIGTMVTWGITPAQSVTLDETLPSVTGARDASERDAMESAYRHMHMQQGQQIRGVKIDVAFIGSCTNGRISDLRLAAEVVRGRKVAPGVSAMVVSGSMQVQRQAEKEGLDKVFVEAGFEWRNAGCSMCVAMNPDRLKPGQVAASSSNRNFIGRQGSPSGRTLLMSPAMVAAAAISGQVCGMPEFNA